jgi:predicted nucleic acid-binding protein
VSNFVALFDACVLYPASVRDLLLRLALTDLFRARWTDRIHDEWTNSVLRQRPDLSKAQLSRTRELRNRAIPDCLVTSFEDLIEGLRLPDPEDRHVLAAAIRCQAGVIVTYNLKHFPEHALASYGIEAQHPDEFVSHLFDLDAGAVCAAVRDQRAGLKNPRLTIDELLNEFLARELTETVVHLKRMRQLL